MARDIGNVIFTAGTGAKAVNIGMTATYMHIKFKGSTIKSSEGWIRNGFQYCYPADGEALDTTKCIKVRNNAGTVILEGTFTSFSGNNVNFNITTNSVTPAPEMLLIFGN